jgi:sigma-B regulation protein RsbU (phosphoserine phosphatase)
MAFASLIVAAVLVGAMLWRWRTEVRHSRQLEEQVRRFQQEKEMAVRFMQEMAAALTEGEDRAGLLQRTVRVAVRCTGAVSGCVYEVTPDGRLRGVAVEGLFPPQRALAGAGGDRGATRAQWMDTVLRSEVLEMGEGVVGSVAQTRQAECVERGANDARLVPHGDPALEVRSLIAAPIEFRGRLFGVLAVANPADGRTFTDTDFALVKALGLQAGFGVHNTEQLASSRGKGE